MVPAEWARRRTAPMARGDTPREIVGFHAVAAIGGPWTLVAAIAFSV